MSVRWNWNLQALVFEEKGKPEYPKKNLSEQGRKPTSNSTQISLLCRRNQMNPGYIGGRRMWKRNWETVVVLLRSHTKELHMRSKAVTSSSRGTEELHIKHQCFQPFPEWVMNVSSRPPTCFLYKLIRLGLNNPWKPCEESLGNEGDKWRKLAFNLKLFYATCNYTLTIVSAVDRAEQEPITRLLNPRTSNCRLSGQHLTNWAIIPSRDQPV